MPCSITFGVQLHNNDPLVMLQYRFVSSLAPGIIGELRPDAVVLDSINTVYLDNLPSAPGSVVQVGTQHHLSLHKYVFCNVFKVSDIMYLDSLTSAPGSVAQDVEVRWQNTNARHVSLALLCLLSRCSQPNIRSASAGRRCCAL